MVNSKDVILNTLPTTYIDIDSKEVKQTSELNIHFSARGEFLKLELQQLLKGERTPIFPTKYAIITFSAILGMSVDMCLFSIMHYQ